VKISNLNNRKKIYALKGQNLGLLPENFDPKTVYFWVVLQARISSEQYVLWQTEKDFQLQEVSRFSLKMW